MIAGSLQHLFDQDIAYEQERPRVLDQPRISDILKQLIPDRPVVLDDSEICQLTGLTLEELVYLRRPRGDLPTGDITHHLCGDHETGYEYAWSRNYPDRVQGVDFALCRRSRDSDQCLLVEIPEDLREVANHPIHDPVRWREFVECLPAGCFQSWHPTIFHGLKALRALVLVSPAETAVLRNLGVHLILAENAIRTAAGLIEQVTNLGLTRELKLQGLIDCMTTDTKRTYDPATHQDLESVTNYSTGGPVSNSVVSLPQRAPKA